MTFRGSILFLLPAGGLLLLPYVARGQEAETSVNDQVLVGNREQLKQDEETESASERKNRRRQKRLERELDRWNTSQVSEDEKLVLVKKSELSEAGEDNAGDGETDAEVRVELPDPNPPKMRLRWGDRIERNIHIDTVGPPPREAPNTDPPKVQKKRRSGRHWKFELIVPQFLLLASGEFLVFGVTQGAGVEFGGGKHMISLHFDWGRGDSSNFMGGGVGYSYFFNLVKDIFRIELGAVAGYFYWNYQEWVQDYSSQASMSGFIALNIRPTLHIGYKVFFFSLGPDLCIGNTFIGGMHTGFTFVF